MNCDGKLEYRCIVGIRLYEEDENGRKVYDARCVKCGHQQDTDGDQKFCTPPPPPDWLVLFKADHQPLTVNEYTDYDTARAFYDELNHSWTEIRLCKVLRAGDRQHNQQPEDLKR